MNFVNIWHFFSFWKLAALIFLFKFKAKKGADQKLPTAVDV